MKLHTRLWWHAAAIVLFSAGVIAQTTNMLPNGGFESGKPALWKTEPGTSAGVKLTWAEDQAFVGTRSLKIEKPAAGSAARWVSGNNVRYWVDNVSKGVDIKLGAFVKTSGVNVNPATADAKWQIKFAFYDTLGVLIGGAPFALDVDQSVATKNWFADTNAVGTVNLPKTAYKVIISAEAGAAATGTVWFDNFIFVGRAGAWAGQNWNGFVDADENWQYWIGPNGGNDGLTLFPGAGVTDSTARTGKSSLKITAPVGRASSEAIFFSETVAIPANSKDKQYILSAWVKTSDIKKDSVFNPSYALGFTWTWHTKMFTDGGGWNETAGGDQRFVLTSANSDWTQYSVILTVPNNDVRAVSVRPRAYSLWTGTSYWDDFVLLPLSTTNLVAKQGGFESGKPALWSTEPGTSAGVKLTWAEDQAYIGTRSLKIEKPAAGSAARWVSGNNVRYWVDNISKGVDIKLGAFVKTSGVNVNPATADAKWQIKYAFYDTLGVLIGGAPFALDVDQTVASKNWFADTNAVGTVNLPKTAYKLIISAEAGASATGTVWFDNFIFVGRAGAWAGQNWNGFVDADSGWQYWIGPNGGNDGLTLFPGTGVTDSTARTGKSSLKLAAPEQRASSEAIFFTETLPIPAKSKDKQYVLSAWMKTSDIKKDSIFNPSYALGFTWTWHTKMFSDAGGWNETAGGDQRFFLTSANSDWTQYSAILTVPNDDVTAVSLRPRSYSLWTGTSYWDDFSFNAVTDVVTSVKPENTANAGMIPAAYTLEQNYPNPFNPSTRFKFSLPQAQFVTVKIYDVIGREIATLANEQMAAGRYTVEWNAARVPSGVYFYRIQAGDYSAVKKMMLLK